MLIRTPPKKTSSLPHASLLEPKTITFKTESKLLFRFQQEQTLIPRAQKRPKRLYAPSNCPMPPSLFPYCIIDIPSHYHFPPVMLFKKSSPKADF